MPLPRVRLRARASAFLTQTGAAARALSARKYVRWPWLTVLTYHRVGPRVEDAAPFDPGLVDASAVEFDEQMGVLARHFQFVGIGDLQSWLRGGALPDNPVLVTFDDAYRECVDVALPTLQRHGGKATFFVSTVPIERREPFWWDRASYILARSKVDRAVLTRYQGFVVDLRDQRYRDNTLARVLRLIKDRHGLPIESFLEDLAQACAVEWTPTLARTIADQLMCSWSDVRALRAAGMDVQSHARTHRVLQTVPTSELRDELAGAREELEAVLREPVRALAYPTGRSVGGDHTILSAVAAAGYDLAFENVGGVNLRRPTPDRHRLRRIPMRPGMSAAEFETSLAVPLLH